MPGNVHPKSLHLFKRADQLITYGAAAGAPDDMLTTKRLSEWWGVSVAMLEIARSRGSGGPPYVPIGRAIRYPRAWCCEWLWLNRRTGTAGADRRNGAAADAAALRRPSQGPGSVPAPGCFICAVCGAATAPAQGAATAASRKAIPVIAVIADGARRYEVTPGANGPEVWENSPGRPLRQVDPQGAEWRRVAMLPKAQRAQQPQPPTSGTAKSTNRFTRGAP
jgi:hypothetical protein